MFLLKSIPSIIFTCFFLSLLAQAQDSANILFENVRVFDGKSNNLSGPVNVLIEGNKIRSISTAPNPTADGMTKIQGNGKTLMPGLIDVHVHMAFGALTMREMMSPMLSEGLIMEKVGGNAERMLMRGFTSVRDAGGPIFPLKTGIDAGKVSGPRIWPSGATISQTAGHGDFRTPDERSRRFFGEPSRAERFNATFIADGRDEILTAVRENLRFGASQIKLMAGGGTSSAYDPVDVTQYTFDEMRAAVEAAEDWGTYVMVHAYTPRAVQRAIKAGVKCVEHGQMLDEKTLRLMKRKDIWLSTQNLVESTPDMDPQRVEKRKPVIEGQAKLWPIAKKMKLKIAWGTDFLFEPELNEQQNAYILKLQQWFTNAEILKMVTHDNAELLQLSGLRSPYPGKLGVVEEGALADLILVDGDPLADLSLIANPAEKFVVIMKDGKVYKNLVQ
ncbi:metal-dependent hydrolase family protein [Cecembia rubra]|uniref:Imidazolonepropionase-like amidohydrolase n=1 Tax=Cecembia rubra TaxID=1485585 RepID=A0A2P8DZR7_9BACT|nr:amidohydrolase family protein [Cecembia rubra]PSL02677.1 imidazolonepropionase-like amidohydrolase [Cecembia rubra]